MATAWMLSLFMYWADNDDGTIYRANLDDTGQTGLITNASNAHQLALYLGSATLPPSSGNGNGGVIPEPTTMLLFGSGLIGLAGFRRKLTKS